MVHHSEDSHAVTYHTTRLPSGLTVATAEMPHMASVSVGLWVGTGGRFEPAELSGVSHFIEHLLFKGTARRSPQQISVAVEGLGGYLNAFTSEENTCFYARAHADHLPLLLDVLMDMFLASRFALSDINRERSVILEELALYLDQPHHHVQELLNELLWPNHPLGRSLTGQPKTIRSISRAQMLRYRREHYVASNSLVAVAGRVTHQHAVRAVAKFARNFPPGRRPAYQPASTPGRKPALRLLTKDTAQTQVAIGLPVCSRHDDRRFALRLLNTLLGDNMSSRLFQVLREEHALAYSIHSGISLLDDVGVLTIAAGLDHKNLLRALQLVGRELRRCRERIPTHRELCHARDYIVGQMELGLESADSQMNWMGEHLLAYQQITRPAQIKQRLHDVTPAQIRRVAQEFLRPEHVHLALISPRRGADDALSCLAF